MIMKYTVLGNVTPDRIDINHNTDISGLHLTLTGNKYAFALDPSVSSTGIIVGNVETGLAEYCIVFARERYGAESAYTVYNQICGSLFKKWLIENIDKIVGVEIEQPFLNRGKQTPANYAKQKACFDIFANTVKGLGLRCITTTPGGWRSPFLTPYKEEMNLDLRQANKKEVHQVACGYQLELLYLPYDASDAFGVWQHFLTANYSPSGVLMVADSAHREYKHDVFWVISTKENAPSYINSYVEARKRTHPTAKATQFQINDKLTVENNLRSFTSDSTDLRYDIYYALIYPSITNIREILKFKKYIGEIDEQTPLFLIGYRTS